MCISLRNRINNDDDKNKRMFFCVRTFSMGNRHLHTFSTDHVCWSPEHSLIFYLTQPDNQCVPGTKIKQYIKKGHTYCTMQSTPLWLLKYRSPLSLSLSLSLSNSTVTVQNMNRTAWTALFHTIDYCLLHTV